MRFRSLLMFACMIVVPMLAMFSHKLPPEVRDACSAIVLNPAIELIESLATPAEADEADREIDFAGPPAGPLLAGQPAEARARASQATALPTPARAVPAAPPVTRSGPPLAGQAAVPPQPRQPPVRQQPAPPGQPQALRRQLKSAGVQRLLLEPAAESGGPVRGSCRLAVDAEGQLQRLFHAHGATEAETLRLLVDQVSRWHSRLAGRQPAAGGQLPRR